MRLLLVDVLYKDLDSTSAKHLFMGLVNLFCQAIATSAKPSTEVYINTVVFHVEHQNRPGIQARPLA